jgi:hypothetical protein
MPKTAPEPKLERVTFRIVAGASDAAADLVKEDRNSTWTEIFEEHPTAVPRWVGEREESAQALQKK